VTSLCKSPPPYRHPAHDGPPRHPDSRATIAATGALNRHRGAVIVSTTGYRRVVVGLLLAILIVVLLLTARTFGYLHQFDCMQSPPPQPPALNPAAPTAQPCA
jgi:hypothetical protein